MAGSEVVPSLELTVAEAPASSVGTGRARIDEAARRALGVKESDVIDIAGTRQTVALVKNLEPADEGKAMIRMDGLVRTNAGVNPGDRVTVRKARVSPAEEVELAPIIAVGHKISFGQGIDNLVRRGILRRPLCRGDSLTVPGIALMGGALPFMVLSTRPEGNVVVEEQTSIRLRREPFRQGEVPPPGDGSARI